MSSDLQDWSGMNEESESKESELVDANDITISSHYLIN
jgi:hypothetical protein